MKKYYEIVFVLNVNLDNENQERILNDVSGRIQSSGGDLYSLQDMGKKRLTYQIEKQKYGQYFLLKYGAETPFVGETNRWLELNNDIMAYIQVRINAEPERIEGVSSYKKIGFEETKTEESGNIQPIEAPVSEMDEDFDSPVVSVETEN